MAAQGWPSGSILRYEIFGDDVMSIYHGSTRCSVSKGTPVSRVGWTTSSPLAGLDDAAARPPATSWESLRVQQGRLVRPGLSGEKSCSRKAQPWSKSNNHSLGPAYLILPVLTDSQSPSLLLHIDGVPHKAVLATG